MHRDAIEHEPATGDRETQRRPPPLGVRDPQRRELRAHRAYPQLEPGSPASSRARTNTSSIIASVSFPVNVFCWLGW